MQSRIGLTSLLAALLVAVVGVIAPAARAADAVPVSVDITELRTMASYALEPGAPDDVYAVVTGVAKGEPVNMRLPKEGTWQVAPKKPGIVAPDKVNLWKGELADGEFVTLTVSLFQGKGEDEAPLKAYLAAKAEAEKAVAERSKKTLGSAEEFKKLVEGSQAAHQGLFKDDPKKFFSREKKTDHFNGQFNVTVWNDGGELQKRVDPLGLVYGEHFGEKEKLYSKIKFTKNNVLVPNETGDEFFLQVYAPVSDDGTGLRVKMLETEYVKTSPEDPVGQRNVTDYIVEVKVTDLSGGGEGEALEWEEKGEHTNPKDPRDIHKYWDWAE